MSDAQHEIALYRVWGETDTLLYVGISNDFGRRWKEHAKKQPWWAEKRRLAADEWFSTRQDAEAAETAAIETENPKYNVKDKPPPRPELATMPRELLLSPVVVDWLIAHYQEHGCSAFGCGCGCRFPAIAAAITT